LLAGESGWIGKTGEGTKEGEPASLVCALELLEKKPTKETREHRHREEEAGPTSDPARAVEREPAARDNTMDMRIYAERRIMPS
jgi:hypothetical protein